MELIHLILQEYGNQLSHRKRDSRGFVLPKENARERTKLRWSKRHVTMKEMVTPTVQPEVSKVDVSDSDFKGMKKVDL